MRLTQFTSATPRPSALQNAQRCLARIAERDEALGAFAFHDPVEVLRQARELDAQPGPLALRGVPVGVKDIFDTADMPTAYGSCLYRDHRPTRDAEAVKRLRSAGALLIGKTLTTEFAFSHPGRTVNPWHPLHTPGGSSSGSAAAVADGMADFALASQTGGSTIRPAAYCGIVGMKPTHGLIPTQGMRALSPTMDTVGLHARTVDDLLRVWPVLSGAQPDFEGGQVRIACFPGPHAASASADAKRALELAGVALREAGLPVQPFTPPMDDFAALSDAQRLVMAREAAYELREEDRLHRHLLSAELVALIEFGKKVSDVAYQQALRLAERWRTALSGMLDANVVLMTFSAPGQAPPLTEGTGSSVFNRSWSLLGLPCLSLPFGLGAARLPLGIQFVGAFGCDAVLLRVAGPAEKAFGEYLSRTSA